ncbi:MAG: hypothetical protein LBK60_01710 [Verrucomicrobiales bacterium]|jgi:hypothetical protein|nr:hypothetical protein [Verrucomicrobiales bacterium]
MKKPRKPAELLGLSRGVETECRKNQANEKWGIDARLLLGLTAANDALAGAIDANADKATKNTATAAAQKAAFNELNHLYEEFVGYLHSDRKIPDAAFRMMGVRPRGHGAHEPLPVPEVAPVLELETGQHGLIKVTATQPTAGQPTHTMAPSQYHAVLLEYRIKGSGETDRKSVTAKRHKFDFTEADAGKTFEIRGAWQNPRNQAGPWSSWVSALIN